MGKARNTKRGRWLEKLSSGRYKRLTFEAKTATAVKAVVQVGDQTGFPHIEFGFVLTSPSEDSRTGEIVDDVRIYMNLEDSSRFIQQALHAIQAATPAMPRPAYNSPFDAS